MLVLSRRESEKILFPTLGITVELLRIRGTKARVGVTAPSDIPVVRAEVSGLKSIEFTSEDDPKEKLSRLTQALRSRLDRASTALNRLHRRMERAEDAATQELVLAVFRELQALEQEAGEAIEPTKKRGTRALLVEDDDNERELLGSYLRMSGFEVTAACDGQDALDYLSLHAHPDVVLVDMIMPRCDGPTLVRKIRATSELAGLKLYAVSGTDPNSLGVATGPGGIDRWFPKPVDPETLVNVVSKALGISTAI
jgi:CheY-like chemotaxis protein/sRNA-binding carbon storage regulator CsrA